MAFDEKTSLKEKMIKTDVMGHPKDSVMVRPLAHSRETCLISRFLCRISNFHISVSKAKVFMNMQLIMSAKLFIQFVHHCRDITYI
jgi:hypothetical protein